MQFNRKLYKQKLAAWGPVSSVQASILKNAERAGINPLFIKSILPFWDGSGTEAREYVYNKKHLFNQPTYLAWSRNSAHQFSNTSSFDLRFSPTIDIAAGQDVAMVLTLTPTNFHTGYNPGFFRTGSNFFTLQNGSYRPWIMWSFGTTILNPASGKGLALNETHTICFFVQSGKEAFFIVDGQIWHKATHNITTAPFSISQYGWQYNATTDYVSGYHDNLSFFTNVSLESLLYLTDNPYFLLHRVPPVFYSVPGGEVLPTFNPLFLNAAQPTRVIQ